jgi:hypothetical protein
VATGRKIGLEQAKKKIGEIYLELRAYELQVLAILVLKKTFKRKKSADTWKLLGGYLRLK